MINILARRMASKIGGVLSACKVNRSIVVYRYSEEEQSNQQAHRKKASFFTAPPSKSKQTFIHTISLAHYLKEFRIKMQKGSFMLQDYIPTIRKISSLYSRERQGEFNLERQQLMKMIDTLGSLSPGEPSLQNFLELLEFIRVMERIEGVKRTVIFTFRDLVFLQMEGVVADAGQLGQVVLLQLYSRMAALNHPRTLVLGKLVLERLQELEKRGDNIGDVRLVEEVVRNLGFRQFLSTVDKQIIKQLLVSCQGKFNKLENYMLLKMADAVSNCEVSSRIADWQVNRLVEGLMTRTNGVFVSNPQYSLLTYVLSKDCSAGGFQPIYQTVYKQLLERMNRRQIDQQLLVHFYKTVQKLQVPKFSHKDCEIFLDYVRWAYSKQQYREVVFKQRQLQLIIMELIEERYFDGHFDLLTDLVVSLPIQIYWGLIAEYSIRNVPFPKDKLLVKIKPKTGKFTKDTNYIKTVVSVWVQARFYSNQRLLNNCCSEITQTIRAEEWNPEKMEWLIQEAFRHREVVRVYLKELAPFFRKFTDKLEVEPNHRHENIRYLYFFISKEYSPKVVDDIDLIPTNVLSLLAYRQVEYFKPKSYFNALLLCSIERHLSLRKISFTEKYDGSILQMLSVYCDSLIFQREEVVEVFWRVVQLLVKDVKAIPKENHLIMRAISLKLINLSNPRLTSSCYYKNYLKNMLDHLVYFSKSFQKEMIISMIRRSLQYNLISSIQLQSITLDTSPFSALERKVMEAINDKFIHEKPSFDSLLAYVSLPHKQELLPSTIAEYYNIIASEDVNHLEKLLIYYNNSDKTSTNEMVIKICESLLSKMEQSTNRSVNFLAILDNLARHPQLANSSIFSNILKILVTHLQENIEFFYVADHYEVIKYIKTTQIDTSNYYNKLTAYISSSNNESSKVIDIFDALHSSSYPLSSDNLALIAKIGYKKQLKALKLMRQYQN